MRANGMIEMDSYRLAAYTVMGRRYLLYAHDEASLLRLASDADLENARVEVRQWAGQLRQLLLFTR